METIYIDYDASKGNTYQQSDLIDKKYGDRIVSFEEIRDHLGYLKKFKIVLKGK